MSERIALQIAGKNARQSLALTQNSWLFPNEKHEAKRLAAEGPMSECEKYLDELERRCGQRLREWRFAQ